MDILDIASKVIVPVAVPVIAAVGGWLLGRLGIRQKQLQIVDLATKRLSFWDFYAQIGISVSQPESQERRVLDGDVRAALARVRADADRELRYVSRSLLPSRKEAPNFEVRGTWKLEWLLLWFAAWFFFVSFVAMTVYAFLILRLGYSDLGLDGTLLMTAAMFALIFLASHSKASADRVKFCPIIGEI